MGSIFKRGGKFWVKYYRNGKCYRESSGTDKKMVAKKLLEIREGEIAQGKLPGILFDKTTFDQLADGFCRDYRINQKKSLVRAERSVSHLKKFFEGMKATAITTPSIQQYVEKRIEEGAANASINRELAALKRMLNLGAKQTPPIVDRVPHIPMLRENNIRKGFFEHGDFIKLRETLPEYLRGFITFGYRTGWRIAEVSNLTWSKVDLDQGIVRLDVGESKNAEGRTVYLDDELKTIFNLQWEKRKRSKKLCPYVFTNEAGTDRIIDIRKSWDSACNKTGIGKRLFHDFRRTAVRNMIRAGIPERVAMMISGHKTRSVFDRYNIVSDEDLRHAAKRHADYLESRLGTKPGTIRKFPEKKESTQ
jgi:integrase